MLVRDMVQIDEAKCNGCGECLPHCVEGVLQIVNGKAKLIRDEHCDGLGACLGHCPQGAITIIQREAAAFDEDRVHQHLEATGQPLPVEDCGGACPSVHLMTLESFSAAVAEVEPADSPVPDFAPSRLRQWPVQLLLVPPDAPFLKNAHLLIAADCVPFAYTGFHEQLLRGRAVVVGCPKLDDTNAYLARLVEMFRRSTPRSITVAHMEVPCCFGLVRLVKQAAQIAELAALLEERVVKVDGTLLS